MDNINTKTNQFMAAMSALINRSELPPVNVRLALQVMASQMADLENQVMTKEQAAEKAKQQAAEKAAKVKENAEKPAPGKPEQG